MFILSKLLRTFNRRENCSKKLHFNNQQEERTEISAHLEATAEANAQAES